MACLNLQPHLYLKVLVSVVVRIEVPFGWPWLAKNCSVKFVFSLNPTPVPTKSLRFIVAAVDSTVLPIE